MKLDYRRTEQVAPWGAISALLLVAVPLDVDGALMRAGSSYQDHKSLGVSNSNDVLWVESEFNGTTFGFSAIRLNEYFAITVGHGVFSSFAGVVKPQRVGNGTNYITDRGITTAIAEVLVYPTYAGAQDTSFSNPDIAIIKFSNPIAGVEPHFGSSLTVGDILVSAGFGHAGFVGGSFSVTGDVLGWNAPVTSETGGLFNGEYYGNTRFSSALALSLNGRGSERDSGSPVYNSLGHLVGMTAGGTPGSFSTEQFGTTVFLDLTNAVIRAWIEENTAIPEPPAILASVTTAAANLTFTNLIASREYRVMRSATLHAWEEAHRFTATAATDSWGESLATGGKMFYRLEWNE